MYLGRPGSISFLDQYRSVGWRPLVFKKTHTTCVWTLSIFCTTKFYRLWPELNPQPWVQKASDNKPHQPVGRRTTTKRRSPAIYQTQTLSSDWQRLRLDLSHQRTCFHSSTVQFRSVLNLLNREVGLNFEIKGL
ncbi:hypothetical protein TNCV_3203851 [Trichonephila clavipes]|nr:hypothetical protein TNCV_3203851 [Trichonephila clavipes]